MGIITENINDAENVGIIGILAYPKNFVLFYKTAIIAKGIFTKKNQKRKLYLKINIRDMLGQKNYLETIRSRTWFHSSLLTQGVKLVLTMSETNNNLHGFYEFFF